MRILVIDDQPYNIASAYLTLQEHDCTTANTIADAYKILESGQMFDVVLTDLWMPRGTFEGAMNSDDTADSMIPAGLVFALRAANLGMKVVICSDGDHHNDRICSLLDLLGDPPGFGGVSQNVMYVEARCCPILGIWENDEIVFSDDRWKHSDEPEIKDWQFAMYNAGLVPKPDRGSRSTI